jgi:hypothetical protein
MNKIKFICCWGRKLLFKLKILNETRLCSDASKSKAFVFVLVISTGLKAAAAM